MRFSGFRFRVFEFSRYPDTTYILWMHRHPQITRDCTIEDTENLWPQLEQGGGARRNGERSRKCAFYTRHHDPVRCCRESVGESGRPYGNFSQGTMLRGTPEPISGLTRRGYVFSGSPRSNGQSTETFFRQGASTCLLLGPGQRPFAGLRRGAFAMPIGEERLAANSRAWVWRQAPGMFAWSAHASNSGR